MKRLLFLVPVAVAALALFLIAGTASLPWVWAYIAATVVGKALLDATMDEGLAKERSSSVVGYDHRLPVRIIMLQSAQWVLAGVGIRFGLAVHPWVCAAGLAALASSFLLAGWSMRANPFFSPVVRIQNDRSHHICTGGPYRFVRHPGYLGLLLGGVAPAAMGSWLPLVLVPVWAWLVLRRLLLEDGFLRRELWGYEKYCGIVGDRLVPRVW